MCVHACARVCLGAHVFAPKRASTFRLRGPRVVRLAGVLPGYSIQRKHRRVEHRVRVEHAPGMSRAASAGGKQRGSHVCAHIYV